MNAPDPFSLKHRPVILLPYARHDGPYADNTDCLYLSVGWAQYEPRSVSVKSLRHTGPNKPDGRWSRQSEELPYHRALDLTILAATTLRAINGNATNIPARTFENQPEPIEIRAQFTNDSERRVFQSLLGSDINRRRFAALRNILNDLSRDGLI